jgi:2-polyprenyl-6-methoxyphenol hydroxylase-like FAD-dependent oxidoreductase
MVERADIAQLLISRQGKFFPGEFLIAVDMPRWSQGRVLLVETLPIAPGPMSGQGTSIALIGAYVLAGELAAASGDDVRAFAEYESVMRPFCRSETGAGTQILKDNEVRR